MKLKLDRIISVATLAASLTAIFLVLKRPAAAPPPQAPAITERGQSSDQGTRQSGPEAQASPSQRLQSPQAQQAQAQQPQGASSRTSGAAASQASSPASASAKPNSDAISAALTQVLGAAGASGLTPDSEVGSGMPNIKDQQVTMDGDVVHGRFLTEIGGKDVWITISGHMGEKDGYATFDPTEFKVGDTEVPVSLVNPELQRKLAEQHDRLKVSDK
jgi:murein L,D-transpeptidase YcbB/YkuD